MDDAMILTKIALDELQDLGYTEAWIGSVDNPHWPRHGTDEFVIAMPKRKKNGWPALWSASEKIFGRQSCGNGLRKADQCQRPNARKMTPGHYEFRQGSWTIIKGRK
jgi:hypothetical protein